MPDSAYPAPDDWHVCDEAVYDGFIASTNIEPGSAASHEDFSADATAGIGETGVTPDCFLMRMLPTATTMIESGHLFFEGGAEVAEDVAGTLEAAGWTVNSYTDLAAPGGPLFDAFGPEGQTAHGFSLDGERDGDLTAALGGGSWIRVQVWAEYPLEG